MEQLSEEHQGSSAGWRSPIAPTHSLARTDTLLDSEAMNASAPYGTKTGLIDAHVLALTCSIPIVAGRQSSTAAWSSRSDSSQLPLAEEQFPSLPGEIPALLPQAAIP